MNATLRWVLILIAFLGVAFGAYKYGQHTAPPAPPSADATTQPSDSGDDAKGVVTVQTVPIRSGSLTQPIVAYGPIQAEASSIAVTSLPFEIHVRQVLVMPGQPVDAGAPLCEVEPSPDTLLQYRQAQFALEAAKKDLAQTQQRFADKLATNSDLLTSQGNLQTAQLKLDSMTSAGAAGVQTLKASAAGIVSKVDVQVGQVVPAGGPLVEVAAGNRIEARLGVEPEDIGDVHLGDHVSLLPVGGDSATPIDGAVTLVSQRINPDTRLVDVVVRLPSKAGLLLDQIVRAQLPGASATGLIVPRQAILPSDTGYSLFTVKDDKAVEHDVTITLENDDEAVVSGDGLNAGDPAVTVGNYELDNGVAVSVQSPSTQPAGAAP